MAGMNAATLAPVANSSLRPRATRLRRSGPLHLPRGGKHFQPANITFDLLPPLDEATVRVRDKKQRHAWSASSHCGILAGGLDAPLLRRLGG